MTKDDRPRRNGARLSVFTFGLSSFVLRLWSLVFRGTIPAMRPTPQRRQWPLTALILAVLLAACDTVAIPVQPADEPAGPTITAPTSSAQVPALPAPALLLRGLHARDNGDYD